jgi:hypothetical protein
LSSARSLSSTATPSPPAKFFAAKEEAFFVPKGFAACAGAVILAASSTLIGTTVPAMQVEEATGLVFSSQFGGRRWMRARMVEEVRPTASRAHGSLSLRVRAAGFATIFVFCSFAIPRALQHELMHAAKLMLLY